MKIGWLHYSIASQSGVETVICRSARALLEAENDLQIRFVGRAGSLIKQWLAMAPGRVSHADVPEMGLLASAETPREGRLALAGRIEERLRAEIPGCETLVIENASVGAHPAFNLAVARLVASPPAGVERFVFRVHDMVFHRQANFEAVKSLAAQAGLAEASARHILFPDTQRTLHLTVSRADAFTLYTLGLESSRIRCLPNFVDESIAGGEALAGQFRAELEARGLAKPGEKLLVYAVRAVPRKNLSEALLLVRLLNLLSAGHGGVPHALQPEGPFRLIVPLTPEEPKFRRYNEVLGEFIGRNDFEATIGLGGLVAPRGHPGNDGGRQAAAFGVAEMYAASAAAITTSALEGFGFGFLEPWCAGRVAIGRRLPVVDDFIRAGMRMDHFYRRLAVDNRDFWWMGEPPAPLFAPVSNEFSEENMRIRLEFVRTLDSGARLGHFLTENRWRIERMLEALVRPARLIAHNRERALEAYSPKRLLPRLQAALAGRPDPAPEE